MSSTSADIADALATRLAHIKTASGYGVDIVKVFHPLGNQDYQPMGANLAEADMPAVIMYQGPVTVVPEHSLNNMQATFYLEIVNPFCGDNIMWGLVNALGKAVFADNPTADSNIAYRFHPSVYEVKVAEIIPDFGMLTGHRIWVVVLLVSYRVRYTNI